MRKLIGWADGYLQECTWKDLALIKFCLGSLGVLIGLQVPKKRKKAAAWTSGAVFAVTYVAVMGKFISFVLRRQDEDREEDFS